LPVISVSVPPVPAPSNQQTDEFRDPGIATAFDVIATLSLIGGILFSFALLTKEYALALLGVSAIVNAMIMFGFAAVIRNVARIAWRSEKAHEQREALLSQARENAKALQWLVDWITVHGETKDH
jgi:hypothetical protein